MIEEELKEYIENFDLSTLYPKSEPKHRKKHKKHKFDDLVIERDYDKRYVKEVTAND